MTPTFSYDKPLPPDDRFGVLACLKMKREHARLFADASPALREEARAYADFALEKLGYTQSKMPSPDKMLSEQDLSNYRLVVRGSTDYSEELVACAKADDPFGLNWYTEPLIQADANRANPLTRECLEQYDCECHTQSDCLVTRPPSLPNHFVVPSTPPSDENDEVEEIIRPAVTVDKGKGVDRTPVSLKDDSIGHMDDQDLDEIEALMVSEACLASKQGSLQGTESGPSTPGASGDSGPATSSAAHTTRRTDPARNTNTKKKSYACRWSTYFGGECAFVSSVQQSLDRHIITHIPAEDGYQLVQFQCTLCVTASQRQSSILRHIEGIHKMNNANRFVLEVQRPWYWPDELFASQVMRSKPRATAPLGDTSKWHDGIRRILTRYGVTTAMPRKDKQGDRTSTIRLKPTNNRPAKRRRLK